MPAMCFILVKDYTIIGQGDDRRGRYFFNMNSFVILKYACLKVNKRVFPIVQYNIFNYELC